MRQGERAGSAVSVGRDRQDDSGSAAVEVTLLAPLMVALLLLVVAAGRITSARLTVAEAAHQAARTLTLTADPAAARRQALAAADALTGSKDLNCTHLDLSVDLPPSPNPVGGASASAAVAVATVRLACTVTLADLTGLTLPDSTVISATATSPMDRYRSSP